MKRFAPVVTKIIVMGVVYEIYRVCSQTQKRNRTTS